MISLIIYYCYLPHALITLSTPLIRLRLTGSRWPGGCRSLHVEEGYEVSGIKFGGEANRQDQSYHKVMELAGEENQWSYHLVMGLGKVVRFLLGLPNWETGSSGLNSWLSWWCDLFILWQQYLINTIYKRKKDWMLPVKTSESIREKPGGTQD